MGAENILLSIGLLIVNSLYEMLDFKLFPSIYDRILYILDGASAKRIEQMRICYRDFQPLKVIGRGAFGEVQLVRLLFDNFVLKGKS